MIDRSLLRYIDRELTFFGGICPELSLGYTESLAGSMKFEMVYVSKRLEIACNGTGKF